jgi:aromatic-L-amino-acid decarboxylase
MLSLAAAREAVDPEIRRLGMAGRADLPPFRVYASDQAHSSIAKACLTLGLGLDGFRAIGHDPDYRMDVAALAAAIAEDRANGIRPLAVVATVGTTSTTSVDPVAAIGDVCRRENLWFHVDAAYAGSAALCPEYRWIFDGAENVDSLVFNPHKWLFTPFDASALYTRKPEIFRRAFSLVPEYLTTPVTGQVVDLMDYGIQLGRRFRALKLWWVIRCFGAEGTRERLRHHMAMAGGFADWIDAHPSFERMAPTPFSVICFRALPPGVEDPAAVDDLNMQLMERVNASGEIYLSHTRLDTGIALRVAIGNLGTTEEDLGRCRDLLEKETACLCRR